MNNRIMFFTIFFSIAATAQLMCMQKETSIVAYTPGTTSPYTGEQPGTFSVISHSPLDSISEIRKELGPNTKIPYGQVLQNFCERAIEDNEPFKNLITTQDKSSYVKIIPMRQEGTTTVLLIIKNKITS